MDFAERDKCKPVLLRLSLARNLEKPLMSLYGSKWRKRCYMDSEWSCMCQLMEGGTGEGDVEVRVSVYV